MREILGAAIRLGGSSISDYVDAHGERGRFQLEHQAYGREGEPCAGVRNAHPQNYRGPTRDPLLPAVPTTVAAASKRALAISSATSTTAFIAFTSCTRTM